MFSHGRSLTGLLVVFFVLLFIPVVGPFIAVFALMAGGDALYRSRGTPRTYESEQERLTTAARRRAEWMALSPDEKQKRLAKIERQKPRRR
jgi:hypothetical protein